jgi:sugar lactone lactonase YvrE
MGELTEVSGDIANPTAIAFDQSGQMFVTSRLDGTVYRLSPFHEAVAFATSLGIATGLAFDSAGRMYVGDRSGTIYRVSGIGEAQEFAQLEPSVSAYHLAFGPDDYLYVTGPTVNSYDVITRVDPAGVASIFFRGLGRPQGLAFDDEGNLYVAASFAGRRGIVRVRPDGKNAQLVVSGMNIVGLAFSPSWDLIVATHDSIFSLPLGLRGALLPDSN